MHELFLKESVRQGVYFNKPESTKQIPSFVQHYMIDMEDYVISDVDQYQNFNEFFTRAILPEKRPIAQQEDEVSDVKICCLLTFSFIECYCFICRL